MRVWEGLETFRRVWEDMEGFGRFGRVWEGLGGFGVIWGGLRGVRRVWEGGGDTNHWKSTGFCRFDRESGEGGGVEKCCFL